MDMNQFELQDFRNRAKQSSEFASEDHEIRRASCNFFSNVRRTESEKQLQDESYERRM